MNIKTTVLLRGTLAPKGEGCISSHGQEEEAEIRLSSSAGTVHNVYTNHQSSLQEGVEAVPQDSAFEAKSSRRTVRFRDPPSIEDGNNDKDPSVVDTSKRTDPWFLTHRECSAATRAECQRFWGAWAGNPKVVKKYLKDYLEWRRIHSLDKNNDDVKRGKLNDSTAEKKRDEKDWEEVWDMTWKQAARSKVLFPDDTTNPMKKNKQDSNSCKPHRIPQYIFAHQHDNKLVLQVLPAQIDISVVSAEHHALAVSLYLDRLFQRRSLENGSVWCDVRGAPGWANPTPFQLIPIVTTFNHHLVRLYPERLHRLVIFPLPKWALWIWKMISKLLPVEVTDRTVLLTGSDNHAEPLDVDKAAEKGGISNELVEQMERTRNQAKLLESAIQ